MKIAHIVSTFPPYHGGMGNVVFEETQALHARGHDVRVYTPQYNADTNGFDEEYVTRIAPAFSYGNAAYIPQLKQELDEMDIVHLHYPFFGTAHLVGKWKQKHPEKKLVITYHMNNRAQGIKGLFFRYYAHAYLPKILRSANLLIASSLDYIVTSDASQIYREDPKKWSGLPFGVDTNRFDIREKPAYLFEQYDLDIKKPTIILVASMDEAHHFKGVDILLKALLILKKNNIDVQTICVGDGVLKERYMLTAQGYGLKHIQFVGSVSYEELPSYYNMADICILPSTSTAEAFGMVLLEAMASGVSVIASDLPGVRSVATDGGLVFPVGDYKKLAKSIVGLLSHISSEQNIILRHIVEETYSWTTHAEKLESIYKSL